jgi:prohibitin 1
LEDVALTHLSFSHEYSREIEAKQVAQQDAERAKFEVMKSEQEREAAVIRAEGESESAKLISQATRSAGPALIELRRIEAAREVAKTLSGSKNIVYLPGGNGSNMLIGVNP